MKTAVKFIVLILSLNFYYGKAQCNFNIDSLICNDTLHDYGNRVIQDDKGNYIICGNIRVQGGTYDAGYLAKTTNTGRPIWKKQFDFTSNSDVFNDIKELPDKSYVILGTTSSTVGINHAFIANIDTNGTLIWYKQFNYPEEEKASQIEITSDNKLIILGYSRNYSQSTGDILLIKTDIAGNLIWRKLIGSATSDENYSSLKIINNNTCYLIGGTERPTSYYHFAVTKLDTAGNVIWKKLNGFGSVNYYCNTICQTFDKGYLVGGKANTQGYIWKLDSTGTIQWSNAYGLNTFTIIKEVKQLADSNLVFLTNDNYLHSSSNSIKSGILTKIDRNGNLLWKKFYLRPSLGPKTVFLLGFNSTKDSGFIMTGYVFNNLAPLATYGNLWLVKTDSLGNDSSNCFIQIGINEIANSESRLNIYPNPNSGNFKIHFNELNNENVTVNISIQNMLGQTLINMINDITNNVLEINAIDLPKGIYFVSIQQNNKIIGHKKLVIE